MQNTDEPGKILTETLNIHFHFPANFKITKLPADQGIRLAANG